MKAAVVPAAVAVLAFVRVASAQSAPQIEVQADEPVAGVGDVVHLQATATSSDAMPSDPRIGATPGFTVRRRSASPSETHININGSQTDRYTLTVDWLLQARRIGTYSVGPPSFEVGGNRYSGSAVTLRIVPAGSAPPRPAPAPAPQSPFGFSPFDPWRGLLPDFPRAQPEPPPVATDPKLSLEAPRDPVYFLHAAIDKTSAVVGEQVTFSVYEYADLSAAGGIEGNEDHDPQAAEFVKRSLLRDDQDPPVAGFASIGGRTWRVRVLRRWALFPLRAGDLVIAPMTVTINSPGRRGAGMRRAAETLHVRVTEPPLSGRPPGYAPGDVGQFSLRASVDPRSVEQGGAVAVHVELSGTGNVPASLTPPAVRGVEWLAPEVHDDLGPRKHDAYGGERTFDFVVRLNRAGDVDLGQIVLPFFDPEQRRYAVARAPLGTIHVAPSASVEPPVATPDRLAGLPPPRDALENAARLKRYPDDSALFWLGAVAGWPLALGAAVAGGAVRRRLARIRRRRRTSPAAELRERIALARTACSGGDVREADAAIVRVLQAAAVASAGINVRGAAGDEVVRKLEGAGVGHEAAAGLAELLRECEAARFAPEAADPAAARDRWGRAQRTLRLLERRG